jgi:DNA mismatch repair ATPase MutS
MRARLMHRDRDFDREEPLPPNAQALKDDLDLDILLGAMGNEDPFILSVVERAMLCGLREPEAIRYRQEILDDAIANPDVVRDLYALAVETLARRRREHLGLFSSSPGSVLSGSLRVMDVLTEMLRKLRELADRNATKFHSEGFTRLFAELRSELDDEYLDRVEADLDELRLRRGAFISARLGRGNGGTNFTLHRAGRRSWSERLKLVDRSALSYRLAERDEAGGRALGELRDRGVNRAASATAQSADHVAAFVEALAAELAFYIGCLNLRERFDSLGGHLTFPVLTEAGRPTFGARGLYDPCLRLRGEGSVVANDVDADGKLLVIITGANQGGKTTFLHSVGMAQLMMQAGMFVAADDLRADPRNGIFTHFRREEDAEMESGKLDEELSRMSAIVDWARPGAMLLCNESFSSTNEAEGSQIAREITRALCEADVKVLHVTHLYDFAEREFAKSEPQTLFLRAERSEEGRRSFRMLEGGPQPTSYGDDVYRAVFGSHTPERPRRRPAAGDGVRSRRSSVQSGAAG